MCSFVVFASVAVSHGIVVFLKTSKFYFMNIIYKHLFPNFGVISFTNKTLVSFFKLHTYKFGLVYKSFYSYIWNVSLYEFVLLLEMDFK